VPSGLLFLGIYFSCQKAVATTVLQRRVLQKHYERMSLVKRAVEAAPRTYGKRNEAPKVVSALDLM
jgi:hypothetical protein